MNKIHLYVLKLYMINNGKNYLCCLVISIFLTGLLACSEKKASTEDKMSALRKDLQELVEPYKANIGIAILNIESGDSLTINNAFKYPMQSVYKFPLAAAVLDAVDKGKLSLLDTIHISSGELEPNTWSPLYKEKKDSSFDITISKLLKYTVSFSDNNTCDILFKHIGGCNAVDAYVKSKGIQDISIVATEAEMHKTWDVQYTNWSYPLAMSQLLEQFHKKTLLSKSSTEFLLQLMLDPFVNVNRLRGLLPGNVEVAHKTGSGGQNENGMQSALNDVGIITLPNGEHLAITVYVANSYEEYSTNEAIIAQISRKVYQYFGGLIDRDYGLEQILEMDTLNPFNGVVLIAEKGKPVFSNVQGYSSREKNIPIQFNDQFVIGSISKQFTTILVLREFEKGKIQLNTPIKQYLTDLKQKWADTVTLHHLLTHTHGIEALNKPGKFTPGSNFDYTYSHIAFSLIEKILEKVTGKDFAELANQMFKQYAMLNTYHPASANNLHLVEGYNYSNNKYSLANNSINKEFASSSSFISNAVDLEIWNQQLHGGVILKESTYSIMFTMYENAIRDHPLFGKTHYGYGCTVNVKDKIKYLGQTGFAPGFACMNFYFPETKTSVIVLQNWVDPDFESISKTFSIHTRILNWIKYSGK